MASISDTVTIVDVSVDEIQGYGMTVSPNQPAPTPAATPVGWVKMRFASDKYEIIRPIYDPATFAAFAINQQNTVTFSTP